MTVGVAIPDEPDFDYLAAVAGFSFEVLQKGVYHRMVYGPELGPVKLVVRRHQIVDGAGVKQWHYDVVSREDVASPSYEEITFCLLYTSPSPRDGLLSRMPSSA